MARKRNIVERTRRIQQRIFVSPADPQAIPRVLRRWPQVSRVLTAVNQSAMAFTELSRHTKREDVSLRAWKVLVKANGEQKMLRAALSQGFLWDCADALETAEIPAPKGAKDGWFNERMRRVRDLIRRHRKRLQTPA